MNRKTNSGLRWTFILGYLGILGFLLACTAVAGGASTVEQGILQLDDDVVKIKNQNGDLEPLAATSSFEVVAPLENTDPWMVTGKTLQTNESTQIEDGLAVGDLVRVRGTILEDDTWLAYSIERAEEQADQTIILIGKVASIDPWVVNGITLNVTSDTVINGEITPGMLVRVEILLLDDGTWEVISISPLGDFPPTTGCATVVATVVSVNGNEVQFLGWPTTVTIGDVTPDENNDNDADNENDENENEDNDEGVVVTTLQPGQKVLVVVCVSDDGQLVITIITVLDDDDNSGEGGEKVLVCHKPEKKGGHTISIASPAVPAHLAHGDKLGPCP